PCAPWLIARGRSLDVPRLDSVALLLRETSVGGLVFRYANTSCSGIPISFSSQTTPAIDPNRRSRRSRNGALSSATWYAVLEMEKCSNPYRLRLQLTTK